MEAPPSPLSSRAYPDFLLAALERAARAVFCKENRMEFATSPTLTGNPGQPRDLQFRGAFLEMFLSLQGVHLKQKFGVIAGLAQAVHQQLHRFDRRERVEDLTQNPNALQVFFGDEQLLFAGAGALDVDG